MSWADTARDAIEGAQLANGRTHGGVSAVAAALGVGRNTVYRWANGEATPHERHRYPLRVLAREGRRLIESRDLYEADRRRMRAALRGESWT